jgi:alkylhydroperoxidase family enzyme
VDIDALLVEEKYKALLRLCMKLTQHAYKVTDEDIDALRATGLTDDEILEGVFVACQFNAVDRLADTFGLYELMQLREP